MVERYFKNVHCLRFMIQMNVGSGRRLIKVRWDVPLTRGALTKLRLKAVRRGCWFRDLKQSERKLLDLTIRVVEKVRSFLLAKVISRLVRRLCEGMESRIVRLIRIEGREMARRLSKIGVVLGCFDAENWASDQGLMQFMVVNNLANFKT